MEHYKNLNLEDIEGEVWLPIQGWEESYEISNKGRVKSLSRKMYGKESLNKRAIPTKIHKLYLGKRKGDYLRDKLNINNKSLKISVHRLVAIHFIPNPNKHPIINHLDCNRLNNEENNLERTTISGNVVHAIKNGRIINAEKNFGERKGITHGMAIINENDVYAIRKRWDNGEMPSVIMKSYPKMTISAIRSVCIRKNWKHLPEKV